MKWIGLTGGIGSGKSLASSYFKNLGVPVIDADEIARKVVAPSSLGLAQVVHEFGNNVLRQDKSLDREKLGQIVFGNPQKLERLESILHPLIQKETMMRRKSLEDKGTFYAIYDVPLLFEKKIKGFDAVIVVNCDMEKRIERLKNRNQWTQEEILQRVKSQIPLEDKVLLANYVINNNGDEKNLESEVKKVHALISQ